MTQPHAPPTFKVESPYPAPGVVLDGKYQVERMLGEGGMGAVARATHLLRRAPVALKFMSPAFTSMAGAVERFVNEGVAASQIDSDHVVKIFDVGQLPSGAPYLVMELLEGVDLSILLVRDGTPGLPVPRAVHFVLQALRGLQVAHTAGIIHRDMKPSNVFVISKDGEPDFVKLVDFGISKVQTAGAANITKTNSALGTPLYMSPEQARRPRDVDRRTDLYSVATILYELLSGRTPYTAESGELTEILFKIFTTEPVDIRSVHPGLPDGLAEVIHRALKRDPAERYATAAEMGEALAPWADQRSAHILSRLRTVERASSQPSYAPSFLPPGQSVIPPAASARSPREAAMAQTQQESAPGAAPGSLVSAPPYDGSQVPVIPPPPRAAFATRASGAGAPVVAPGPGARTDMGAGGEAVRPAEPRAGRTWAVIGIAAAVVIAVLVGGVLVVARVAPRGATKPDDTATAAVTTAAPKPPSNDLPPALSIAPPVTVDPPASATSTSATPSAVAAHPPARPPGTAGTAATSANAPPKPPGRPGQLTDIKPAQ